MSFLFHFVPINVNTFSRQYFLCAIKVRLRSSQPVHILFYVHLLLLCYSVLFPFIVLHLAHFVSMGLPITFCHSPSPKSISMNMLIFDLVGNFCLSSLLGDVCNINYSDTLFTCRLFMGLQR